MIGCWDINSCPHSVWLSPTCDCLSVIIKSLIFCCVSLCCRLHYKYRIYIALCIMAVLFALTVGFTPVPTQHCKILCKELNNFSNSLPPHLQTGADGFFSLTLLTVLTLNGMSVDFICYFSLKTIYFSEFFLHFSCIINVPKQYFWICWSVPIQVHLRCAEWAGQCCMLVPATCTCSGIVQI